MVVGDGIKGNDMVKKTIELFAVAVVLLVADVWAAPAKGAFEPVPNQALKELKATVGRPFSAGLVFIDGKYIPPPYKVERYGTAFRINKQKISNQVIPWDEFLKTQEGVRIERSETQVASAGPAVVAPAPEPEATDYGDDFDDLFDDDPKPKKAKPKTVAKPRAPVTRVSTKVIFDGEFAPNAKTKMLLDRLNKMRTNIEISLRKGGACFFGSGYGTVRADKGPADMFLATMPDIMRRSSSFDEFVAAARSKGIVFLSEAVLRDLYRNKIDYIKLRERARKAEEDRKWNAMLNNAGM